MAGLAASVTLVLVLMLAVCALAGGALARSGCGVVEGRRTPRMRSALDEGNDSRPSSALG